MPGASAMKSLKGRVAVVTGAASGIGLAMAGRFAAEGMKLVLADVEVEPLGRAERSLRSAGAEVLAVPTDVAKGIRSTGLPNKRGRHSAPSMSCATTPARALRRARHSGK